MGTNGAHSSHWGGGGGGGTDILHKCKQTKYINILHKCKQT